MARFDAGTIEAILRLRDEFTGVAKRVATQARTLGTRFTDVGQRARAAGAGLTTGVTLPLVGIGTAAVKASTNLNASMAEIATLIPGNTERVKALKGSVQELAISTGQGTADMAGGLYQVISAVGDTQDTVKILEINARAATAGLSTTSEAIQLTSAVTKGYGETSSAAFQQVSDLAFQAVKLGQTTFPELAGSIGRVVPLSAELQVSQEELFGVMATGTGVTGGAAEVSTQLRGVLQSLLSPTAGMTTLLASMGLESGKALIEQQGLQGAIDTVVGAAARAGAPLQDYVSSIEGQTLALALAGPQADTFTEKLAAMQTATGSTDQAFAEMTEGINAAGHQFKQLWQEVVVTAQRFGDELIPQLLKLKPTLTDMVEGLKATVQWFADLPAPVQKTILVAVGLVAALGPLLLVVGQMSMGVGALLPLLGSLGSGFAMLMTPSAAFAAVLGKVGLLLAPLKAVLVAVGGAFTVFTWPVTLAIAALAALLVGTEQGRAVLAAIGRVIKEVVVFAFNLLRDVLVGAGEKVGELGKKLIEMIPQVVLDKLDKLAKWIGGVADAIGRTNAAAAATDHLARLNQEMLDLGTSTGLTKEAMDRIARQAIELRDKGQTLTVGLARIVDHFQKTTLASEQLQATLEAVAGVTSIADLSNMTMRLAESGQSSSDVMKVIAERARALQTDGSDLTTVLQNVVNAYGEAATAGEAFGENTGGATPPVKALAKDVQTLIDTWTGASLESKALVAAFETLTVAQRGNDRVMTQVLDAYDSMRTVLGPFNAELEQLWQTHERLKTPLESNTDLTDRLTQAQVAATQAQAALNERLDAHRRALLGLPTDEAIAAFEELQTVWASFDDAKRDAAMGGYATALRDAAAAGIELTAEEVALVEATADVAETTAKLDVTLAALAGQMGGAAGQAMNLAVSMIQTNDNLKEGEEGFSRIQVGAALASSAFHTLGDAIGGTAGKILSEVGNIAQAFATGGLVGGIIAGVGAAIKGIKSLFGGASEAELAGRETAGAFRDGVIATLNDGQLAEASQAAAMGAWRGNEQGAQFLIGVRDAYVSVGRSAAEAEAMVNRLWEAEARGPEAVAAVQREMEVVLDQAAELRAQFEQIAELHTFDSATDQLQQLTSAAEFFGVEADEMGERLGNAFKAVEQAATAEDIAQHVHTLLASGVDLGTALDLAKDKVQGVITASLQMGTEIPAAMQPIAAQLIEQGQLLDESGKKITDINQLDFGTSMTEGIEILVLSMNQLVETMGGEVPAAAQQFADGVAGGADAAVASVEQVGQAVDGVATEDLPAMAQSFDAAAQAAASSLNGEIGDTIDALKTGLGAMSDEALPDLAKAFAQTASQSDQALQHTLRDQIDNLGLAVHDLSAEALTTMASAFEVTAQAAGLSLEGVLGEQLDALKAGLESTTRDELPGLARAFQQTATDAVQAFDRIPRTLTFEQHTRYSSSGSPGTTNGSGLQSGTHGRFVDFGGGTSVVLHGRERVVTEAEGRREAADLSGLRQELADLTRIMERGQDELPFRMSRAIRDAMAETV